MDIREQKLRELSTETSHAIEMLESKRLIGMVINLLNTMNYLIRFILLRKR